MIEIKHYDGPNHTRAVPLIAAAAHELECSGWSSGNLIGSWDHQVILAISDSVEAVGVLTWDHQKWSRTIWVTLGYVVPHFRKSGVYRRMWDELILKARELGVPEIQGGTHVGNKPMLDCATRLGRVPLFITTSFKVPPKPESKLDMTTIETGVRHAYNTAYDENDRETGLCTCGRLFNDRIHCSVTEDISKGRVTNVES
jgi:hypothetical protein